MSDSQANPSPEYDNRLCVDVIIDCVPDPTPWTMPPELLKILMAERDEIARWEAELKRQQAGDQATDGPSPAGNDAPK